MEEIGVLPEPDRQDRQAGRDGGIDAAVHRRQRRWTAEPLQRGRRGRRSEGQRPRRAGRDERLDSRRAFADQDQHDRGSDVHVAAARPGGHGHLRQERLLHARPSGSTRRRREFDITSVTQLPRVDIIFAYADMSPDLIDGRGTKGAKGIVIAGVGNGNMNKASLDMAAQVAKKGVVVVRSSRVATGTVGRNVELNDDELGFIASDELNPQKSRILLTLALLKPRTTMDIQKLFQTY